MKNARIPILIGFFLTVSAIVTFQAIVGGVISDELRQARESLEMEKIELAKSRITTLEAEKLEIQQRHLQRNADLTFYGAIGLLSVAGTALLIVSLGYHRARVRQASVHIAQIGAHSKIPIHQRDLQSFYPIAVNLSLAEIEASTSTSHDKAYRISRQMLADITDYTRALAGKRGMLPNGQIMPGDGERLALPTAVPTLTALLQTDELGLNRPLIMGYDRQTGQPERRQLKDLKSLAVAGWQGSGKTLSTAYLIGTAMLAYRVKVFVVDPHKHHPEGLYATIKPLERTGLLTVINPFDTPALLQTLTSHLDRRLSGQESSAQGILLVIDELARLAKIECFDVLVKFLERCTEETRKANITFIGCSTKWSARHFKGRADIRGCMNSALVHNSKPSQAELLLEDKHDRQLMREVTQEGQAILTTDNAATKLVQMPLCTRQDMERIAQILGANRETAAPPPDPDTSESAAAAQTALKQVVTIDVQAVTPHPPATNLAAADAAPDIVTRQTYQAQRKAQGLSLREVAERVGLSTKKEIDSFAVKLSRFETKKGGLEPEELAAVTAVLFPPKHDNEAGQQEPLLHVTTPYIQ